MIANLNFLLSKNDFNEINRSQNVMNRKRKTNNEENI